MDEWMDAYMDRWTGHQQGPVAGTWGLEVDPKAGLVMMIAFACQVLPLPGFQAGHQRLCEIHLPHSHSWGNRPHTSPLVGACWDLGSFMTYPQISGWVCSRLEHKLHLSESRRWILISLLPGSQYLWLQSWWICHSWDTNNFLIPLHLFHLSLYAPPYPLLSLLYVPVVFWMRLASFSPQLVELFRKD